MLSTRQRLGELLVSHRLISQAQLDQALALQKAEFRPLGQILIQKNFITEERLLQACALQRGFSAWHLQHDPPTQQALALVPGRQCQLLKVLPVMVQGNRLILAMRDPSDVDAIDTIRDLVKMRVEPVLAGEERLMELIDDLYGGKAAPVDTLNRLVTAALTEFDDENPNANEGNVTEAEMRPVTELVNQILVDAVQMHASDIHIEPRKGHVDIRYRIDGQLHKMHEIPGKLQAALIARLKIMAVLDIVEYRIPQDGRMQVTAAGHPVDLRVSVLPNHYGQRIVMRVLDKSQTLRRLPELGFAPHNYAMFQEMIHKPYGLILVTGPTGSGKTTTLYAALNQIKSVTNNIMTCEDPIEYDIDGINQSHVNEKVGLTFAVQLRAILRQDPDIVLVGEIRDKETAETALRAALTGHLVLSTLHCNDATSAIPRLIDMGIEPFLLSTALIGVTAQRLLRVLCKDCKQQYSPDAEERALLATQFSGDIPLLWRPVGCPKCSGTGFMGRMGVHEILPVGPEVQRMVAACEPVDVLRRTASQYGYRPMQGDACDRVRDGQTSLAEARRLVYFDSVATPYVQQQLRAA